MKITIKVNDLDLVLKSLETSMVALHEVYMACLLGCEIPYKFKKFFEKNHISYENQLKFFEERLSTLKNLYTQLSNFKG